MRAIVLRYTNLFDDVVNNEALDFDEEPDEEQASENIDSPEQRAQALIHGSGSWEDELE